MIRSQALDPFGCRFAICNVLHGAVALFNEDMAMALCSAINDWVAKELLDREPRLRASILVPVHNPERAVAEIERVAPDRRFVQVLLFAMGDMLLGRPALLADLYGGRKARARHRHPRRQHLPARAEWRTGWSAHRVEGLRRPIGGVRIAALELPRRGRVPTVSIAGGWC